MHDADDSLPDEAPSKSQRKRDSRSLRTLGETLVELPAGRLDSLPLGEALIEAIALYRRIPSHGARKRQLGFIAKLLRATDPEPIEAALQRFQQQDRQSVAHFHHLEQWRDRLLEEGDTAIDELLEQFPAADRQHLRQLVRQARKDQAGQKTRGPRALFRYLRELPEPD